MNGYCIRCGAAREGAARFCIRCGAAFDEPGPAAASATPVEALENASRLLRFVNNLLDGMIANVIMFTTIMIVWLPAMVVNPDIDTEHPALLASGYLVAFATSIVYYWLFELRWGRTPAKWATSTKVVRTDGGAASSGQILGRSAARLIPFEALVIFFNADRLTLHDIVSGTRVVRVPR